MSLPPSPPSLPPSFHLRFPFPPPLSLPFSRARASAQDELYLALSIANLLGMEGFKHPTNIFNSTRKTTSRQSQEFSGTNNKALLLLRT